MTAEPPRSNEEPGDAITLRRLRLDLEDLRFENARLKTSIAERQDEILALSERLETLHTRVSRVHRVTAWILHLRRFSPLRLLLRRR